MSTATPRNYKAKRSVRPNIEHSVQVCILFFRRRFPVEVKLTDKPLDKVVYRNDARYAAVLVKHHRHRLLLLFHVGKKHVCLQRLRHKVRLTHRSVHHAVTAFVTEALDSYQNLPLLPPCVVPEEDLCVLLPPELLLLSGFAVRVTVW